MILQPYGTTIAIAILVGAYVASLHAKQRGQNSQLVWDGLLWALIFGLIGARLYHVLSLWEFYRANPLSTLFLWNGGLGIYGALVGGVVGLGVWRRVSRGIREIGGLLDIAAPGVAVGQAIGRFANFFSQELYGWPTKLPWGIYIKPENRFPGLKNFSYFHPLFLYEALWNLLNFVILLGVGRSGKAGGAGRKRLLTGERFLLYLSFYALGRFFLESLRIESWMIGGVRVAQVLSVLIILASIAVTVLRRAWKKNKNLQLQIRTLI